MLNYKIQKGTKVVWSTYYLPALLIGLFVNDEIYKNNLSFNYKWIQFEWLWSDTLDSMRTIKCWMTHGYRINNNKCEFQKYDIINKKLFNHITKTHSFGSKAPFTDYYINEIVKIFTPFHNLLVNALLNDRPNVLIGHWQKWDYFD